MNAAKPELRDTRTPARNPSETRNRANPADTPLGGGKRDMPTHAE